MLKIRIRKPPPWLVALLILLVAGVVFLSFDTVAELADASRDERVAPDYEAVNTNHLHYDGVAFTSDGKWLCYLRSGSQLVWHSLIEEQADIVVNVGHANGIASRGGSGLFILDSTGHGARLSSMNGPTDEPQAACTLQTDPNNSYRSIHAPFHSGSFFLVRNVHALPMKHSLERRAVQAPLESHVYSTSWTRGWDEVAFSSNGRFATWGNGDHETVDIWDTRTDQLVKQVPSPDRAWAGLHAISDDGRTRVQVGRSPNRGASIASVLSVHDDVKEREFRIRGHVSSGAMNVDGSVLLLANRCEDLSMFIPCGTSFITIRKGAQGIRQIRVCSGKAGVLRLSPDGQHVAVLSNDGGAHNKIRLWKWSRIVPQGG